MPAAGKCSASWQVQHAAAAAAFNKKITAPANSACVQLPNA
jgi:hypothetical protein